MQNKKRQNEINEFLSQCAGLQQYSILDMGFDASTRKYFRIVLKNGSSKILLDDEGCNNRPKEFAELSDFLLKKGIRAPEIFAKDLKKGLMLLEDFGESDFVKKATAENEKDLLRKAVDVLVKLHKVKERPACVADMDEKIITDNFALFTDWYVPACSGKQLTAVQRESFFNIVKKMMPAALKLSSNLVLWDYHVNNVMYPDNGDAAIIDFQDAMWGPGLYDLASLIEDERRDIPETITQE
ncbi:MAG: phosphotransferase [Alphaproteobacteria bacterium]|nr:phosphotransferase [Alphaproteobacteria bacterium]